MNDLRKIAAEFKDKLKKIKVCAFDVDGILTTGHISWDGQEVGWNRFSQVNDGYGLKVLMQAGLKVGVISGGDSLSVRKRYQENLGLDFAFLGNEDKREAYSEILAMGFSADEVLYMGDELFDIPLLKRSGFSATVLTASLEVQESVDYIAARPSGYGCAREVIDILRYARDIYPDVPEF